MNRRHSAGRLQQRFAMDWVIICTVAFLVSMLTLFSGFGLGTIRMPAFALFFPVPVSVAATAVVHLVNNIFKVRLMGRQADTDTVLRFALPAVVAAMLGAALLDCSPKSRRCGAMSWPAGANQRWS